MTNVQRKTDLPLILCLVPGVGCVIGGVYFIGNYALQESTGQSVGELVNNIAHMNDGLFGGENFEDFSKRGMERYNY